MPNYHNVSQLMQFAGECGRSGSPTVFLRRPVWRARWRPFSGRTSAVRVGRRGTLPGGLGKAAPEAGGAVPSDASCSQVGALQRSLCRPAAAWLASTEMPARIPVLPARDPKQCIQCIVKILRGKAERTKNHCYTLQSTLHTPHFTQYTPHFALYTLHSALHALHFTLYTLHSALHTSHSTLCTSHSRLYTPHSTLYTPHSTLYTPHFTLHTRHFTLPTPHFYTPHFTHYTPHSVSFHGGMAPFPQAFQCVGWTAPRKSSAWVTWKNGGFTMVATCALVWNSFITWLTNLFVDGTIH